MVPAELAVVLTWLQPYLVPLVGALALGALVTLGVMTRRARRQLDAQREALTATAAEQRRLAVALLEERLGERERELARQDGRVEELAGRTALLEGELNLRSSQLTQQRADAAALAARLEENRRAFAEREALIQAQTESLRQEFELLARRIFEREGEQQQVRLSAVLDPLREQLADFRNRVETVYTTETRDRATLLTEVRSLQQASERINREAENLARALKGDIKAQGNWGEMVLERVLEASGLRAGHEYFLQASLRDSAGALKRPDVVIRLPDDKDVVVDAKLSLLAYEQAVSAEAEDTRNAALREHVVSLRAHVRRLAEQDYDRLENVRSLDFVLLFVPIEAAFTAAMEQDQRVFNEAFERRIVIVSPTTLMMTLRIIHNVWRYEKQNRNAEEIARRAGALYDKVRGLAEDLETLGRQLQTADNTYRGVMAKLASGRGNVIRQVEQFRELGAAVRKPLPRALLDEALEYGPDDALDAGATAWPEPEVE
jgi:DNA recombination protein RmuC